MLSLSVSTRLDRLLPTLWKLTRLLLPNSGGLLIAFPAEEEEVEMLFLLLLERRGIEKRMVVDLFSVLLSPRENNLLFLCLLFTAFLVFNFIQSEPGEGEGFKVTLLLVVGEVRSGINTSGSVVLVVILRGAIDTEFTEFMKMKIHPSLIKYAAKIVCLPFFASLLNHIFLPHTQIPIWFCLNKSQVNE